MKKMKHFDFLKRGALIVLAALTLTGCSQSLESKVEEMNSELPMTEDGFTFKNIEIEGNYLVFYADYDERDFRLDNDELRRELRNHPEMMKEVWHSIASGEKKFEEFTDLCKKEKKGIRIILHGLESNANLTLLELKHTDL